MLKATNSFRLRGASIRSTARPQPKSMTVESTSSVRNFGFQQA